MRTRKTKDYYNMEEDEDTKYAFSLVEDTNEKETGQVNKAGKWLSLFLKYRQL